MAMPTYGKSKKISIGLYYNCVAQKGFCKNAVGVYLNYGGHFKGNFRGKQYLLRALKFKYPLK